MHKTAREVVNQCRGCTFSKAHHFHGLCSDGRQHVSISRAPWDIMPIDYVGPMTPDVDGYNYLVVMCNFSKYVKLIAVKAVDGLTMYSQGFILSGLYDLWFSQEAAVRQRVTLLE